MNSKKHWPSIFMKSKSSSSNSSAMRPLYQGEGALSHNDVPAERERIIPIAKTKTRWHPKPDQIQMLEAIFKSGMVNPPREEIQRIRAQLQEFGHVEDVNVFYWFQNRKARAKRKRQLQDAQKSESRAKVARAPALSSSSSTSTTSTSTSVQCQPTTIGNQHPCSSALPASSFAGHHYNQQVNQEMGTTQCSNIQPVGAGETTESRGILNEGAREDPIDIDNSLITVFINDIPIQLPMGPINFSAFFGDIALLLDSSGHLVLVNELGFTMEGLEHGATYYLI